MSTNQRDDQSEWSISRLSRAPEAIFYGLAILGVVLIIIESLNFRTVAYVTEPRLAEILHERADDNQMLSCFLLSSVIWYGSSRMLRRSEKWCRFCKRAGLASLLITVALTLAALFLEGNVRRLEQMKTISHFYPFAPILGGLYLSASLVGFMLVAKKAGYVSPKKS